MGQSTGEKLFSFNPFNGELMGELPICGGREIEECIAKAERAFREWRLVPLEQRAKQILALRDIILERAEEICELVTGETGEPISETILTEIYPSLESLSYYAEITPRVLADAHVEYRNRLKSRKVGLNRFEPVGIIGIISSWVFPFSIPISQIVPALIAGNAVILKPSEYASVVGMKIKELFEEIDIPDGLVSVVTGDGRTGEALVRSDVNKIVLVGTTQTGRVVMRQAAEKLHPVTLFLSSKGTALVMEDANLDRAVKGILYGAFLNSGQACGRIERVYVERRIYEDFIVRLALMIKSLRMGNPMDPDVEIGPQTTPKGIERLQRHLNDALRKGARALVGRGYVEEGGMFFEPILLADADEEMLVMREETLGPLLPVVPFDDLESAVQNINETSLGLHVSVWTSDPKLAMELSNSFRAGTVCVNDVIFTLAEIECPWGGVGLSGMGKMHGEYGLRESCFVKHISYDDGKRRSMPWWFPYDERYRNLMFASISGGHGVLPEFLPRWRDFLSRRLR